MYKYPDGRCSLLTSNNCADGYYKSSYNCLDCPTKCVKCSSATLCTLCEGGSFIQINPKLCGNCLIGAGEFISGFDCVACIANCK